MNIKTTYLPLAMNGQRENFLEIKVYYHLGGINYFTYKHEERGYYISVTPVAKSGYTTITGAFTGIKQCMIPCNRQSKKRADEAFNIPQSKYQHLIDYVLEKNGYSLAD